MKLLRYILLVAIAASPAWLLGACSLINDDYPVENDPADSRNEATLVLSVATVAPSRAGESIEKMHSLRVVLVDADTDAVEYNDFVNDTSRPDLFDESGAGVDRLDYAKLYRLITTYPGRKTIYFIANEESVAATSAGSSLSDVLGGVATGSKDFAGTVNSIAFTPDFDKPLVYSSTYDFTIPESVLSQPDHTYNYNGTGTFWVVPAATKFEFSFENMRTEAAVTVESLSVSAVADRTYLLADVRGDDRTKNFGSEECYWVEWLRRVSDETQKYPDRPDVSGNKDINARYGWISNYLLPTGVEHADLDIIGGVPFDIPAAVSATQPTAGPTYTVYAPESRNMAGDVQKYTFTISVRDNADGKQYEFTETLGNLAALFRNTHVKVWISIGYKETELELKFRIGICPWDEVTIDIPTFD